MTKDKKVNEDVSVEDAGTTLADENAGIAEDSEKAAFNADELVTESPEDEYVKLQAELASVKDQMLRRQADFDNYKKRMVKLQDDNRKFAIRDIAFDVVQINDNLLRAIEASATFKSDDAAAAEAHDSFVQGVIMISKAIESVLENYGVVEMDALNKEFDPNLYEAIEIESSADVAFDTVTHVHRKGFMINDIVLRSAQVKVTKPEK